MYSLKKKVVHMHPQFIRQVGTMQRLYCFGIEKGTHETCENTCGTYLIGHHTRIMSKQSDGSQRHGTTILNLLKHRYIYIFFFCDTSPEHGLGRYITQYSANEPTAEASVSLSQCFCKSIADL